MDEMWLGDLDLHASEDFVIEDVTLLDPPRDSSIRYVVGVDFGADDCDCTCVTMAYIVPDGYWPPVNSLEEWASSGFTRRCHRIEHDGLLTSLPAKYQRLLLFFVIALVWWVVYGADKVLG